MKIVALLISIAFAILLYFSIKFGFDLKTAIYTLFLLIVWSSSTYFLYRIYSDAGYSKFWFYMIFGILLSFCIYPLLNFYSLKTESYDLLDWAGLRENNFKLGIQKLWFGVWYGKLAITSLFATISIVIQQIFDND